MQPSVPLLVLNVPGRQPSHVPAAMSTPEIVPLNPGMHRQSVALPDDTGLTELAGQFLHDDAEVCAVRP